MTALVSGGLSLASGLFGMIGGMRGSKAAASPGIAPLMYMISGQEQQQAARDEAGNLSAQSRLAYEQSLLDAQQKQREYTAFKEQQALKFASSGVTLQGSPLGILEETQQLGQQEQSAILRRGQEVSSLYEQQGLQMLRRGSAAAFGGFAQSLQSQYQSQVQAAQSRNQAVQTGLSGLQAGIQGLGAAFGGRGGGGSNPITGFYKYWQSNNYPPPNTNLGYINGPINY
ncbi:MAG: hypothetical protein K2X27_15945 [Candidatus Obscuribacterales bacterium]|nr:hypothetical protein [Candidatus Obscuribacterales bacterium]